MTNITKVIGKIFGRKENDMDFWLNACATINVIEERPYKARRRRYSINSNVRTKYK